MYSAIQLVIYFSVVFVTALPIPHRHPNAWSVGTKTSTQLETNTFRSSHAYATTVPPHSEFAAHSRPSPPTADLSALFPITHNIDFWSTSPAVPNALALADITFRPTYLLSEIAPTYVAAPDGKRSMRAHYPQGSYTLSHKPLGGLSFYAPGPTQVDLSTAKEATFGYSVLFPEGFEFNLGGKLPGLYGGNSESEAVGCSDGRHSSDCFSARIMWRQNGEGEMYTYLPPSFSANNAVCDVQPFSTCNSEFGDSVGRGAFRFTPGQRATVGQRVRLNDVGQANGELQVFMNGQSVISVKGLVLRDSEPGRIRGIQMQTFFGGHSADYASPRSQDAFFSDFSVAITEKL